MGGLDNVFVYLSVPSGSAQSSLILPDPQLTSSCMQLVMNGSDHIVPWCPVIRESVSTKG